MGFQYRKRTKGKNSWLNISHSKKNGLSASLSVKVAKGVTMNFGGKGNRRATVNFGNGFRYVKYRTPKAKERKLSEPKVNNRTRTPSTTYTTSEILTSYQNYIISMFTELHKDGADNVDMQITVDLVNSLELFRGLSFYEKISRVEYDTIVVNKNLYVEMLRNIAKNRPEISGYIEAIIENINYFVHITNGSHRAPVTDFKPETTLEKLTSGVKRLFSAFK